MKARDVVGKKIKRVDHSRWFNSQLKKFEVTCERIILEDGTILYPWAFETEEMPAVTIKIIKGKRSCQP